MISCDSSGWGGENLAHLGLRAGLRQERVAADEYGKQSVCQTVVSVRVGKHWRGRGASQEASRKGVAFESRCDNGHALRGPLGCATRSNRQAGGCPNCTQ